MSQTKSFRDLIVWQKAIIGFMLKKKDNFYRSLSVQVQSWKVK